MRLVILILALFVAAPGAQQPAPAPSPAPKPMTPVATNTMVANPDVYIGQLVTVTAAVEQIFSRSAFSIDQRVVGDGGKLRAAGKDVLVVAPTLNGTVDVNAYVTVIGEVVRFDPDEIARRAKDYKLDLAPDVVGKYSGRPAVLATAVINAAMVDLARRLPPPMTAQEEAFSKVMKKVGPAFAALRTAADGSNTEAATQNATVLKQAFTETEAFWKARGKADATAWAQDARKHVESIATAVAAGNWEGVKTSAGALGQQCQSCHGAYRERFDDGSYRIKTGSR